MTTNTLVQAEIDFNANHIPFTQPEAQPTQEKKKYNVSEANIQAWANQVKSFTVSPMNNQYIDAFRESKYPLANTDKKQKDSWAQYKSSIGNFLEIVGKDAVIIKNQDLIDFVAKYENENTKANKIAHIKSFLTFLVKENIGNCNTRISREVLIMIISMGKDK
jgi:hypothetical protein